MQGTIFCGKTKDMSFALTNIHTPILAAFSAILLCLPSYAANATPEYIFVGPRDTHWKQFYIENGRPPKQWTAKEKTTFAAALNSIRKAHPSFYARAISAGRPIGLIRRNMTAEDNSDPRGRPVCMLTGVATIEVDDIFFTLPADWQRYAVTHEFAHLLDTATFLSSSPEFIKLAQPAIDKVHKLYGNLPFAPLDPEAGDRGEAIAHRAGLPNLDSAESLPECFAECVAHYYIRGPKSISAPIRNYIERTVNRSNSTIDRARELYVETELATDIGDYHRAFLASSKLLAQQPQMLEVHCSRARIWGFKRDFEMMEIEAQQELALLRARRIPKYHWTYERANELLTDARDRYGFDRVVHRMSR